MRSTESDLVDSLSSFYEREFPQSAKLLSDKGIQLLADRPDSMASTYFIQRRKPNIEPADFELDLEDLEKVRQYLRERWAGPERDALAELTEKILALAPQFASVEQKTDVSPFMYVMF